jgi:putative DNA methylase
VTVRKKLIEVSIPLEAINVASAKEKSIRHGHPSTLHLWWARRPLAACRAVLFAQLVDDPSSWPDRYPTEAEQAHERRRLHKVIEAMVPWEASNNEVILNSARWEIARSVAWGLGEEPPAKDDHKAVFHFLQTKAPPVYDPFSGGGSIPLEAQRLGLRAYGSDLNPVAVLIGKALVAIPPKFAGLPPVNPNARAELKRGGHWSGKGAQGLAEDVRYYGKWMRDEAEKRVGSFYPKAKLPDGTEATVIAWLWARTVRSPDPAAKGAMVPLVSSFMLSTKEGRKAWVEPVIDLTALDGWRFEVRTGELSKSQETKLKEGTIGRSSGGTCILSGASMPFSYVRSQGQSNGLGVRLMAIVAESQRGRIYLSPDDNHEKIALSARPRWQPDGELPNNPRDFKTPNYGLKTFASLFTSRQLLGLTTFCDLVADARQKVLADVETIDFSPDVRPLHSGGLGKEAYADAVATYLAFACSRAANYSATICVWSSHPKDELAKQVFMRQAIPMTWDFAETNPFAASGGSLTNSLDWLGRALLFLQNTGFGEVTNKNASKNDFPGRVVISTDPPYYDNIGYADLSDFFYVWLRKSLSDVWPDLFRRLATPKDDELVATPYRHGGKEDAERFFINGMSEALSAMRHASTENEPLAIYYAFKQSEASQDGLTSAGWSSFVQAIVDSGLLIDGTWPIRMELTANLKSKVNALASAVVIVCRKRAADAGVITRADFVRALKRELPDAIDEIRKAGVGPVDMQQSVIGPGMGVFSRNSRVLEDDDTPMSVRTALALINRVWEEIENELDAAFDAETQVALAWYASYGFDARPSGELIALATAKNTSDRALFGSGVFQDLRGKAGLTTRDASPGDWSPSSDRTLTVWECVQHTARVLNAPDGGGEAAARLVGQMGPLSADARKLAYRLFEIATNKGWSAEALVYNELAQEWPKLEDIAAGIDTSRQSATRGQGTLEFGGGNTR